MSYFTTMLALCLPTGHLKPSIWGVSPHLWHIFSWLLCSCLNISFSCGILSFFLSSCWYLWLFDFGFNFLCFLWYLLGGTSVHWCLSKFTCVACGSFATCLMYFAVDSCDSSFFANCLTLLAGNLSRSMLESFIVLETNSSSLRKKQKMSLCNILAVSWGYFAKLISDCTALYHSSTDWSPCLKLVSKSNLALISFVYGLQNSSNFCQITSKHVSSGVKSHEIYWSMPKSPDQATTFLHFLASESIANSQSNIFSHFIFHLMNLLYKLSSTVQFILGPSMYGTYILVGAWCGLTNTSCS